MPAHIWDTREGLYSQRKVNVSCLGGKVSKQKCKASKYTSTEIKERAGDRISNKIWLKQSSLEVL